MKNKSLFSRLLDNKKLMLLVSLILSFVFWMISSDNTTRTIEDVQLNYSLSESASEELKVFGVSSDTVSVVVSGKRVIIDSLSEEDITASVDLFSVSEPCTATYDVVVENSGSLTFDIDSVQPESVTVVIDREATKTVNIVSDFKYKPDGYYVDNNLPETVTLTGPESIVNNVQSAFVSGSVTSSDAQDVTNTFEVKLFDKEDPKSSDAKEISTDYITMSHENVEVLFRFMKINQQMPVSLKYEPSDLRLTAKYYTITPSTLSVAGKEHLFSGEDALTSIGLDIGSLSRFRNQIYNETFKINDVLGTDLVNKSEGVENIRVQLDFSSLAFETFDVPSTNISVKNLPEGYSYTVPPSYAVSVVGPQSTLDSLTKTSFSVEYDFKDILPESEDTPVKVPVSIKINRSAFCWVYRSTDTASVVMNKVD